MSKNILRDYPTPPKDCYKVYVRSCTYNQAPYIEDCLNGVAMQKTDFPFVHHVIDDCSTDGEQDVIKAWIERECHLETAEYYDNDICTITLAKNKSNPNCTLVAYFLKKNMFRDPKRRELFELWQNVCPYIALCEGDDYWTDPLKLQKQFLFMEAHPDHTLCVHAYRRDSYKDGTISSNEQYLFNCDTEVVPDEVVLRGTGMFAATATMFCVNTALDNYPSWARTAPVGDRPMQLVLFSRGHVGFLADVMSVYRVGISGSWTLRVHRNTKANKILENRIIQMYNDFDVWTNGKYHNIIVRSIRDFKKRIIKFRIIDLLYRPYSLIKRLIIKS